MQTAQTLLSLSFAVFFLAGCAPEVEDVAIEEIDGVTYVRNGTRIDTTSFPFELILEQTFGAEEEPLEATLASVIDLWVDKKGTLVLSDFDHGHLASFNQEGRLLWTAGSAGQAPGELNGTSGIIGDGEIGLLIGNGFGTSLDRWTTDGVFVDQRMFSSEVGRLVSIEGRLGHDRLILSSMVPPGMIGVQVSIVDSESLMLLDSLTVRQTVDAPNANMLSARLGVALSGDDIFIGTANGDYEIRILNLDSGLERVVTREVDLVHRPSVVVRGNGYGVFHFGQFKVLGSLPSSHFLTLVSGSEIDDPDAYAALDAGDRPDVPRYSSLDAFDEEGRYIGSMWWNTETPGIGRILTIGEDGKLYTMSNEPFP